LGCTKRTVKMLPRNIPKRDAEIFKQSAGGPVEETNALDARRGRVKSTQNVRVGEVHQGGECFRVRKISPRHKKRTPGKAREWKEVDE